MFPQELINSTKLKYFFISQLGNPGEDNDVPRDILLLRPPVLRSS